MVYKSSTHSGGSGGGVTSFNSLTGDVNLVAGTNITLNTVGNNITISASGGSGSGTVTSVSVVSANGFAGTVANATTTPAITISTSITGILKGNGTAISAATAGTDYQVPITLTTTGTSGAATFIAGTLNIPNYANTTYTAGTGLTLTGTSFSVNVSQNISTLSNLTLNGLIKTSGGTGALSIATAGTDYQSPITLTTTGSSGAATFIGNTLNIPQYSGGSSGASAVTRSIAQASHGFTTGQILKFTSGAYALAQADGDADQEVIGIASSIIDANDFVITTDGYVTGLSGLTANTQYFLSATSAGALTATEPTTVGQVSKPVFFADSTTSGYFHNYRGMALSGASNANILVGRSSVLVNTGATGNTQIPADNTIPQNTEGDQYMSITYTPASTSNILVINAFALAGSSASTTVTMALFQDSSANALAAQGVQISTTGTATNINLKYIMSAGTTSSTTFKIRIGGGTTGTTTFNGAAGTQRYGGVCSSGIEIQEFTQ